VVGAWAAVKEALDRLGLLTVDTTLRVSLPWGAWTVPSHRPAPARSGLRVSPHPGRATGARPGHALRAAL